MIVKQNVNFYDIETLNNVFTLCNFNNKANELDIYVLCDDPLGNPENNGEFDVDFVNTLAEILYEKNKNFTGSFTFYDLKDNPEAILRIAQTYGLSDSALVNNSNEANNLKVLRPDGSRLDLRPVCDTDADYDPEKHPYLMGYNSYNYDTTMLALLFSEWFDRGDADHVRQISSMTAQQIRDYSNDLFLPQFKDQMPQRLIHVYENGRWEQTNYNDIRWRIRKNMLMTGRHIDVARLNEKQSKVGLKRILGLLGHQILESDKLSDANAIVETCEELCELIAYNVSDVVNLELVLANKQYQGQLILKNQMLQTYPELVYDRIKDTYQPDIKPYRVRRDRLTADASSAQFAAKCLCPYDILDDIPAVSFMYPSEAKSKETGIARINVLDECKNFFHSLFPQQELRDEFEKVYAYYKTIEGKDFNQGENNPDRTTALSLAHHPKADTCMTYYNADGTPSSCFVQFSTGGIHGAEYNKTLYDADVAEHEAEQALLDEVMAMFPEPTDLQAIKTKSKKTILADPDNQDRATQLGAMAERFIKSGATLKKAEYRTLNKPQLFAEGSKGMYELNKKYTYSSYDFCTLGDFASYYPNMLRMLSAFWNPGLGYDRYADMYQKKQDFGKLMKDMSLTEAERGLYDIQRDGTKLVLNAASGAADANFENSIRMNNNIISMRIIGQLFLWRIGQAMTYEGSKVISTNTDGLYAATITSDHAAAIIDRESQVINIEIEPIPCYLFSKDTNNRMKTKGDFSEVTEAKGGTLGCRSGPDPSKALSHPAIIDWALGEYLMLAAKGENPEVSFDKPFNDEAGLEIIMRANEEFDDVKFLNMFQNVTASSLGTMTYIFGTTTDMTKENRPLQHYNRVFIMREGTPDTLTMRAAVARKITPATAKKRERDGLNARENDPVALSILASYGIYPQDIPMDKEASVKKINGINENWHMRIENRALDQLERDDITRMKYTLDYDKYNMLLRDCFEASWRNKTVAGEETAQDEQADESE